MVLLSGKAEQPWSACQPLSFVAKFQWKPFLTILPLPAHHHRNHLHRFEVPDLLLLQNLDRSLHFRVRNMLQL